MPEITGSVLDPEFRKRRAQHAAKARTSLDHYVRQVVERAPDLTDEQRTRLAAILRGSGAGDG